MRTELDEELIKKQLQDARHRIVSRLLVRDEIRIEYAADEMDKIKAAEAREITISCLDRSASLLLKVDEALQKLDRDEYGICANCDGQIGVRRLRAIPWAQFCLNCQETVDLSHGCGHEAFEVHPSAA
jgi:DnaK suppressor protein